MPFPPGQERRRVYRHDSPTAGGETGLSSQTLRTNPSWTANRRHGTPEQPFPYSDPTTGTIFGLNEFGDTSSSMPSGSSGGNPFGWLSNMKPADWARLGLAGYGFTQLPDSSGGGGYGPANAFMPSGAPVDVGMMNLMQILMSQGQTPPQQQNMVISDILRGAQQQQTAAGAQAARTGMQNSGVNQAIQAAIGQSGGEQVARYQASEDQLAQQRMREDLGLLLDLFIRPQQDAMALSTGQYNANREYDTRRDTAVMDMIARLVDSWGSRG